LLILVKVNSESQLHQPVTTDNSKEQHYHSVAVRTVVRATQQVNGKWPFSGCQNSVTPEPID